MVDIDRIKEILKAEIQTLHNNSKLLLDNINNLSFNNNSDDELSIGSYDNNNAILYYMGTALYTYIKYFQSKEGLDLSEDMMNKVKVDEIYVSNDDSLKLLHKEISLALSNATSVL